MNKAESVKVVQAFLDAYNARDVEQMDKLLSENVVHEDDSKPSIVGKTAICKQFKILFEQYPTLHSLLLGRMALGQYVIDHEYITGRDTEGYQVFVVNRVENGKIVHMRLLRDKESF